MDMSSSTWKNADDIKAYLADMLNRCKNKRREVEAEWISHRASIYGTTTNQAYNPGTLASIIDSVSDTEDFDNGSRIEVSYSFRNLRLVHSHASANPPVGVAKAATQDQTDKRAADAASQVMNYFRNTEDLHELNDMTYLGALVDGTGITRTGYDPYLGKIVKYNEKTGQVKREGKICIDQVKVEDFWPDPFIQCSDIKKLRFTIERRRFTKEEIRVMFPRKWKLICQAQDSVKKQVNDFYSLDRAASFDEKVEGLYELYWYFEPGNMTNNDLGRMIVFLEDGTPVTKPAPNPNVTYAEPSIEERKKAIAAGVDPEKGPPKAYLPYQIMTDVDMPNRIWGRSNLYYVLPAQNLLTHIDSATVEAVKVHGLARLILPPGAQLAGGDISNSNTEVVQLSGDYDGTPQFLNPPGLPQAMPETRSNMRTGIDDMWGVNDFMFGNQARETSGYAMQYGVNQGSMIRRRFFNKAVRFVRQQYQGLLALAIQHWVINKIINVLGAEGAYDAVELSWVDIFGGYSIEVEYGNNLPLDPEMRRERILQYYPMAKEAGVPPRAMLKQLAIADFDEFVEGINMATNRAKEIIDRINIEKVQQPAYKYQDHEAIMAHMISYTNSAEWEAVDAVAKRLIEEHIDIRVQMAAERASGGQGAAGGMPQVGAGAPTMSKDQTLALQTPPGAMPPAQTPPL